MKSINETTEYYLVFKDNTPMGKEYDGEFISENKDETDKLFEKCKEQVEQYYSKTWEKYKSVWCETDVVVIYDYRKEEY